MLPRGAEILCQCKDMHLHVYSAFIPNHQIPTAAEMSFNRRMNNMFCNTEHYSVIKPKLLNHEKGWRTRHCQLEKGGQERLISYDCDYHILGINKAQTKVSVEISLVVSMNV